MARSNLRSYERTSMNEQERSELEWLKRRQARLEQELNLLSKQVEAFELRVSRAAEEMAATPEPPPQPMPAETWAPPAEAWAPPPPIPPIIPVAPVVAQAVAPPPIPVFE